MTVKHGNATLKSSNACYSIHSNKSTKCDFSIPVSQSEADKSGDWTLVVTNNSNDEVIGFDIAKNGDINPLVPSFKSTYKAKCQ